MSNSKAPNTLKAYRQLWAVFTRWCDAAGKIPMPATSETLQLFAIWGVKVNKYRMDTVRLALAAIRYMHESSGISSPVDFRVREVMEGLRRDIQEQSQAKEALEPRQLEKVCRALDAGSPRDVRDRAVVLLGFASACRRSELAALDLKDVVRRTDSLVLCVRRSKTDQEGKGRTIGISRAKNPELCPIAAFEAWLQVRGKAPGPLFLRFRGSRLTSSGICGQTICNIVKSCLKRIGENPKAFGAHSMRAGMVTTAAEAGASDVAIRMRTGHKSIDSMLRYVRPAEYFHNDPLAGVL